MTFRPTIKSKHLIHDAWLIWLMSALFYCYQFLSRSAMPSVFYPELKEFLQVNDAELSRFNSLFLIAYSAMQLPVGILLDRFSIKNILSIAIGICAAGDILFAIYPSYYLVCLARLLMGIGASFAFVSTIKVASLVFQASTASIAPSIVNTLGTVCAFTGAITLGYINTFFEWRYIAIALGLLGFLLLAILRGVVRDKLDNTQVAAVNSSNVWQDILSVISNFNCWLLGLYSIFAYSLISVFADWFAIQYIKEVYGTDSKSMAASIGGVIYIGTAFGAPILSHFSNLLKVRKWIMCIALLLAAALFSAAIFGEFSPIIFAILLFLAAFFAGAEILVFVSAVETMPSRLTGTASSFVNMICMLGGAVLQSVCGLILSVYSTPDNHLLGYKISFLFLAGGLVFASMLCIFMKDSFAHQKISQDN